MDDIARRRFDLVRTIFDAAQSPDGGRAFVITRSGPGRGTGTACSAAAWILGIGYDCVPADGSLSGRKAPAVLQTVPGNGSDLTQMAMALMTAPEGSVVVIAVPEPHDLRQVAQHVRNVSGCTALFL